MNYGIVAKQAIERAKKFTHCPIGAEVGVILVGDKKMRRLNRIYRGKDKVTNVLSFPVLPHPTLSRWERETTPCRGRVRDLGDIFICIPQARREAKKYDLSMKYQIARLALHGFLHLLGYDHKNKKKAGEMEKIERKILC